MTRIITSVEVNKKTISVEWDEPAAGRPNGMFFVVVQGEREKKNYYPMSKALRRLSTLVEIEEVKAFQRYSSRN